MKQEDAAVRPYWTPPADALEHSRLGDYLGWLRRTRGLNFADYESLWEWSVDQLEDFWQSVWDYFGVVSHTPATQVLASDRMPGAVWFPGATLNYAENALRHQDDDQVVVIARSQTRPPSELTRGQLRDEVARFAAGLKGLGVQPGDRVAGYLPNVPEAVIGLLACASLGAVWAVCPPEFGVQSVVDRIGQLEPKVLLVADGYKYGDREVDRREEIRGIRAALPSVESTVLLSYLHPDAPARDGMIPWDALRIEGASPEYVAVPFDHPLWVLFSSGTTGLPKAIVHGHGGIVLEHLKIGGLIQDLQPGDRYFFFSTTAWMVWNRSVSTLLTGAAFVVADGNPTYPSLDALFDIVDDCGVTSWGVGATYLARCQTEGLRPRDTHDLRTLRSLVGSGSPVALDSYAYVHEAIKPGLHFFSGTGGTDVCTTFASGTPLSTVIEGEMPARMLGVAAYAFDDDGRSVVDTPGELVITRPMPSMPLGFWGDEDQSRYRNAYFARYPGVWHHGDRFIVTGRGTCNVLGRSDATLNRGGVRLGTSDFYTVLEELPEIDESLVVHLEDPTGGTGTLVLLVAMVPGHALDERLKSRLSQTLRERCSPRHVPDEIHEVPAIPKTGSGKKLEVPVKRILQGADPDQVAQRGSLSSPTALDAVVSLAVTRSAGHPG